MHDAAAAEAPHRTRLPLSLTDFRACIPSGYEAALAAASALLLVLAFPNFEFWWLAWFGLAPLLYAVARVRRSVTAFLLGWLWGTIFFYGTCWWLTYSMIHYGRMPAWLAYPLLLLPVMFGALFPAAACAFLSRVIIRFGMGAILTAPLIWVSFELVRYAVTGLAWNAIGYSQAFHPQLILSARWGGVYAISFLIVMVNAVLVFAFVRRTWRAYVLSLCILAIALACTVDAVFRPVSMTESNPPYIFVVAVQPNVPMETVNELTMQQLLQRHIELGRQGLANIPIDDKSSRLVVWPESPMNFSYSRDPKLQSVVSAFARANQTAVLLNSLEPAPNGGDFNSAILVNEEGQKVAQYDKIRLMPFGEYVPLPRWLPGSGSVRSIVGEFTPGSSYTLMPLGAFRAGVFICIEAAHPAVARSFAHGGADVLINISNDGYLGPTPVMRQHLANAVFRAVESNRDLLRVTNTGISAHIDHTGRVSDATAGFQPELRTWSISKNSLGTAFYTRHGDVFVYGCALISLGMISATFMSKRFGRAHTGH
ncbi:MAG TPA: apolipoprotein N-acyltransferase [Pyrinomonadaceae bacterium]|nr:apolipoprotein N-acyltransferase [Pyrinomonadaceae bacterium]